MIKASCMYTACSCVSALVSIAIIAATIIRGSFSPVPYIQILKELSRTYYKSMKFIKIYMRIEVSEDSKQKNKKGI